MDQNSRYFDARTVRRLPGLPSIAQDFGFGGANFAVTSSLVLTTFLVGYAVANVFGGIIMCFAIYCGSHTGHTHVDY